MKQTYKHLCVATLLAALLLAVLPVQAQTIRRGQKFWDGAVLYTVSTVKQNGDAILTGRDSWSNNQYTLKLDKGNGAGAYILRAQGNQPCPFRCQWGNKVTYFRRNGMNLLAVYNSAGTVVETIVLTPDNLRDLNAQQEQMGREAENSLRNATAMMLMNTHMLTPLDLDVIQAEARRLGRLQRPSFIQQINKDLLNSEIQYRNGQAEGGYDNPDGLGSDGRGSDETENQEAAAANANAHGQAVTYDGDEYIRVNNARQFINALASEHNVLVARNTEINLTQILFDQDFFSSSQRLKWKDTVRETDRQKAVVSEEVFDGRQLTLVGLRQITIRGEEGASIVVEPRYAFCLRFVNCEQCQVMNLTIGHTTGGNCQGGVIGATGGWRVMVFDCDLYGCGTYGLDLNGTRDFSMYRSKIHDCTYGIMILHNTESASFHNCEFFRNKEFALIESHASTMVFDTCRFYNNNPTSPLFSTDREFFLRNCNISHPEESLGTMNFATQLE